MGCLPVTTPSVHSLPGSQYRKASGYHTGHIENTVYGSCHKGCTHNDHQVVQEGSFLLFWNMALPPYSAFLFIILQLLCKISSNDFGKSGNIPDICKILSKNLLLRRQIFLFPGENTQHAHSLAAQLTDLGCSGPVICVLPMIRSPGFFALGRLQ